MSRFQIERTLGEVTSSDIASTIERAKREAAKFGSIWDGDTRGGSYVLRTPLGKIEGTYTITDGVVRFDIEKKPSLVPRALIERVLDEFLRAG